jgi:autotransporter-associated beta strand protein
LNAVSGTVGALNDNATAATEFTGVARPANEYGTNSEAALALALGGTNTASTYSGNILHVAGSGTLSVQKDGTGTWAVSGTNTYTGATTVNTGTLKAASNGALGAGDITVTGGTLELLGVSLTNTGRTLTLASAAGSVPLKAVSGTNSLTFGGGTLNSTGVSIDVASATTLTLTNSGAITEAGGSRGFAKTGAGELTLAATANTYTGTTTITAGKLTVANTASLGSGSISLNSTLSYAGSSNTTSSNAMSFTSAAPVLEAVGTGSVTWGGALSWTTAPTITLTGTSTAANTISAALADAATVPALQKTGTGTWYLTGALSHSGTNTVSAGTLEVDTANSNTMSGAVSVASSATLRLVTDANPALANTGRVLGTSNVAVAGNLKTALAGVQRGRMRYGGNVTFNGGAVIHPGTV